MEEIWKDVVGFEGLYEVSNFGKVHSLRKNVPKEKMLTPFNNDGYLRVTLRVNEKSHNMLVHRMVATAFIENPEGKECVNHIDGNKKNNCVSNLEWATKSENTRHAIRLGLRPLVCERKVKRGAENPNSKIVAQIGVDGDVIRVWPCAAVAAETLSFDINCIRRTAAGYKKSYRGFLWKYI